MNTLQLRFINAGLFFLLILPSGLWLSHSGKPYSLVLFNIHKLIGFGLFVFLAINVFRVNQASPLSALQLAACLIAATCFLATIVTGGLVSSLQAMPGVVASPQAASLPNRGFHSYEHLSFAQTEITMSSS